MTSAKGRPRLAAGAQCLDRGHLGTTRTPDLRRPSFSSGSVPLKTGYRAGLSTTLVHLVNPSGCSKNHGDSSVTGQNSPSRHQHHFQGAQAEGTAVLGTEHPDNTAWGAPGGARTGSKERHSPAHPMCGGESRAQDPRLPLHRQRRPWAELDPSSVGQHHSRPRSSGHGVKASRAFPSAQSRSNRRRERSPLRDTPHCCSLRSCLGRGAHAGPPRAQLFRHVHAGQQAGAGPAELAWGRQGQGQEEGADRTPRASDGPGPDTPACQSPPAGSLAGLQGEQPLVLGSHGPRGPSQGGHPRRRTCPLQTPPGGRSLE